MQGNVAYINTDPDRPKPRPAAPKKRNANAQAAASAKAGAMKRERAESRKSLASTLVVVFVAFCALSLMVSRYAAICTIGAQNNEIKSGIQALEAQIDGVSLDMELKDNVAEVQSKAQDDLKMSYPRQDQKISINMSG